MKLAFVIQPAFGVKRSCNAKFTARGAKKQRLKTAGNGSGKAVRSQIHR